MKNTFYIFLFLLLGLNLAHAQQTTPKPTPKPAATPNQKIEIQRAVSQQNAQNQRFNNLHGKHTGRPLDSFRVRYFAGDFLETLYRKPTSEELDLIKPNEEDLRKYSNFLKNPNTGIIKLINDAGCSENSKIIVATAECLKYKFPGAGSSYSFRTKSYRLPRLADLTFTDNSFQATGVHLHGIFVNIGDIPLERVNSNTEGMEFLLKFMPSTDYQSAAKVDRYLSKGIVHKGFIYRRALYMQENTTFVLRSIAYRGKYFRAVRGMTYNELNFDKRRDVIVAFQVIRKHADGSISLLWKEISNKKSPKLKR